MFKLFSIKNPFQDSSKQEAKMLQTSSNPDGKHYKCQDCNYNTSKIFTITKAITMEVKHFHVQVVITKQHLSEI